MRQSIIIEDPRDYRNFGSGEGLKTFRVVVETSDLYVKATSYLKDETERLVHECRSLIKKSIEDRPQFLTSLVPIDSTSDESVVTFRMLEAGRKAGVGPMAAVAGAVADYVGRKLMNLSEEVIIENGGDLFIFVKRSIVVGIYAGSSPFSHKIGLKIGPTAIPVGVSTSSGKVGPSRSFGAAHAATILSNDPILADAVATGMGNRISRPADLGVACRWAMSVEGVSGCVGIVDDKMAALGNVELIPIN